jgi:predicted MPP superfamily phosphohydrolase
LAPDVIALTGDIVHYGDAHLRPAGEFLKRLRGREANLAVLGNHDYYDDAHGENIIRLLAGSGFELLKNASRAIVRDEAAVWMVGLDDLWHGAPDIIKALADVSEDSSATVMLVHNPLLFDPVAMTAEKPVDLVIGGHTHAGHVYIPFLGPIYRRIFRMKYRYGLFEKNNTRLHVTSGVGSAAFYLKKQRIGFPPFRFNTCPEIAVLDLVSG